MLYGFRVLVGVVRRPNGALFPMLALSKLLAASTATLVGAPQTEKYGRRPKLLGQAPRSTVARAVLDKMACLVAREEGIGGETTFCVGCARRLSTMSVMVWCASPRKERRGVRSHGVASFF